MKGEEEKQKTNNKKGISLIVLVITVTSTYNETTKYRKVLPENIMKVIRKITYNKESVRIILADSLCIIGYDTKKMEE